MIPKQPIYPERVRKVPRQFSWIDHRLVRERHIEQCSHAGAALYLFLVTVADAKGLSYYSDASIGKRLNMEQYALENARLELCRIGLIAYASPIYQVLPLDTPVVRRTCGAPSSLRHIFKQMAEGES